MPATDHPACPLCCKAGARPFAEAHRRRYFDCDLCGLLFLDPGQRLDRAAEVARYETHENDPADPRYRAFLSRLADPLAERLSPGAKGLDYGSGPGPTLSVMLRERGFAMELYDPFFAPDPAPLDQAYDFITCSETAEHFFDPRGEFERLNDLLRPGGLLAVMTELYSEGQRFEDWRYARDPTHVCFFGRKSMWWIAEHFGWALETPHPNVALFRKPPRASTSIRP